MAAVYSEFDTTVQNVVHDLRNKILTSNDWTKINPTTALASTSAASAAGGTALIFTSGAAAAAGIVVGSSIRIGASGASDTEFKTVTAVAATTVTVTALNFAHPSGTAIYPSNEVLKATTTAGVDLIVDLASGAPQTTNLIMTAWRAHTGTVGTDATPRWVYWKETLATITSPLHVVLSVSKEHIYFSIEGPRSGELSPQTTTYGSYRNYFFMDTMVPYHASDTVPAVFCGGSPTTGVVPSVAALNHLGHLTRRQDGTAWDATKLSTLGFPGTVALDYQRQTTGDGKYYLFPYVCISDVDGVRGRLKSFFFAGYTLTKSFDNLVPPVNSLITYGGQQYKLLAVNHNPNDNGAWGQFGASTVSGTDSVVVAVPYY